jgi:hypothetical protein
MGHISTAVASQIGRDLAVASRFDFNFHSFLSELTMGLEWWQRKTASRRPRPIDTSSSDHSGLTPSFWQAVAQGRDGERVSVLKGRISTSSVRASLDDHKRPDPRPGDVRLLGSSPSRMPLGVRDESRPCQPQQAHSVRRLVGAIHVVNALYGQTLTWPIVAALCIKMSVSFTRRRRGRTLPAR